MTKKILSVLLVLILPSIPACVNRDDSTTSVLSVVADPDCFALTACAPDGGYSLDKNYEWNCTTGLADVVFDSSPGTKGTVRVTLRDGASVEVFEMVYDETDDVFVSGTTYPGLHGRWSAQIEIVNLEGRITISIVSR